MALHKKRDFAAMCGLEPKNLAVYVGRKQVIVSGDYIDDSIQINKDFLAKRKIRLSQFGETDDGVPNVKPPEYVNEAPNVSDPDDQLLKESVHALQKKKLITEITQKEHAIALAKIKIDKQNGILIPTDLVKMVFTQHSKSIVTEFKNAIDGIITKIAKRKDLNANEVAELRGELIQSINEATSKSIETSKKNINNIIAEYSETKEVGEHS